MPFRLLFFLVGRLYVLSIVGYGQQDAFRVITQRLLGQRIRDGEFARKALPLVENGVDVLANEGREAHRLGLKACTVFRTHPDQDAVLACANDTKPSFEAASGMSQSAAS